MVVYKVCRSFEESVLHGRIHASVGASSAFSASRGLNKATAWPLISNRAGSGHGMMLTLPFGQPAAQLVPCGAFADNRAASGFSIFHLNIGHSLEYPFSTCG